MTASQHSRVPIVRRFTEDGYDWPTPHPVPPEIVAMIGAPNPIYQDLPWTTQPMSPYWRAQLLEDSEAQFADVPQPTAAPTGDEILAKAGAKLEKAYGEFLGIDRFVVKPDRYLASNAPVPQTAPGGWE